MISLLLLLYSFLSFGVFSIGGNLPPVVTAYRENAVASQIIWTGPGVTTWPVSWGRIRDPVDPNRYLVTYMQMRNKAGGGVEAQTYTKSSDGTLYRMPRVSVPEPNVPSGGQ